MKHIPTFKSFTYENQEVADFVQKFDLTDISSYDKDTIKFIKKVIKLYNKQKITDIEKEFPDYKERMKAAYQAYNDELIRMALPQGDLQNSTSKIPTVDIKWGKE